MKDYKSMMALLKKNNFVVSSSCVWEEDEERDNYTINLRLNSKVIVEIFNLYYFKAGKLTEIYDIRINYNKLYEHIETKKELITILKFIQNISL